MGGCISEFQEMFHSDVEGYDYYKNYQIDNILYFKPALLEYFDSKIVDIILSQQDLYQIQNLQLADDMQAQTDRDGKIWLYINDLLNELKLDSEKYPYTIKDQYGNRSSMLLLTDDNMLLIQEFSKVDDVVIRDKVGNQIHQISKGYNHITILYKNQKIFNITNEIFKMPYECSKNNIIDISAGNDFTVVLNKQGRVYLTGKKDVINKMMDEVENIKLSSIQGKIVQISAGSGQFLLLTNEGVAYGFGLNQSFVFKYPDRIQGEIVQISAGHNHSLVLTSKQSVFSAGYNTHDQLSIPQELNGSITFVKAGFMTSAIIINNTEVKMQGRKFKDHLKTVVDNVQLKNKIKGRRCHPEFEEIK